MAESQSKGKCALSACARLAQVHGYCKTHNNYVTKKGHEPPTHAVCEYCGATFLLASAKVSRFCYGGQCRGLAFREPRRAELAQRERARRANDPDSYRIADLIRRERTRDARNARAAIYRRDNREKVNASVREWGKRNLDKKLELNSRRRARMSGASAYKVTGREKRRLMNRYLGQCAYCGSVAEHFDHVVPLARGGSHSIGNLLPACAQCNLTKGSKLLIEWRLWNRDVSKLYR